MLACGGVGVCGAEEYAPGEHTPEGLGEAAEETVGTKRRAKKLPLGPKGDRGGRGEDGGAVLGVGSGS